MGFIATLAAWLTGCRSTPRPAAEPPPTNPGTNIPLAYPIVALTTEPGNINYFESEVDFTTRRMTTMFWPSGAAVIDTAGGLYSAEKTVAVEKPPNPIFDAGRTPYRIFVGLKRLKTVDVDAARKLVVAIVRDERSYWSGSPQARDTAIAYIQRYRTVAELVKACQDYSSWR